MISGTVKPEVEDRLLESLALWGELFRLEQASSFRTTDKENTLKGLWIVTLYAALECAINQSVNSIMLHIETQRPRVNEFNPSFRSLVQHSKIKSIRDGSYSNSFDKARDLFVSSEAADIIEKIPNPLYHILQNVDAGTIAFILKLFGSDVYDISPSTVAKLENLRERRNAIAHGRESAKEVGRRFRVAELKELYDLVDYEIMRFIRAMDAFCSDRKYLRAMI